MADPTAVESWWNSVAVGTLTTFIVGLMGLLTWYANSKRVDAATIAKANNILIKRVTELEREVTGIKHDVIPISAAFQAILIKDLTHAHTPEIDDLLRKVGPPFILTEDEVVRLSVLLERVTRDMGNLVDEQERDAATMLPLVMKRVLSDKLRTGVEAEPLVRIMIVVRPTI